MAPTEGRVTKPEWWWGRRRGTPLLLMKKLGWDRHRQPVMLYCCHSAFLKVQSLCFSFWSDNIFSNFLFCILQHARRLWSLRWRWCRQHLCHSQDSCLFLWQELMRIRCSLHKTRPLMWMVI